MVRGVDFAALDPNQEKLRRELASIGITYFYRPSQEARVRRDDAFTLEEAAVAMACLGFYVRASGRVQADNVINLVVTAKAEIGRLWERDGELYQKLFPDNLAGVRLCRLVQIYRFIDEILAASERSEPSYQRRMFFRHGRYFIMAFVAHRSQPIIKRLEFYLSEDDRRELSRTISELAELIYAVSEPRQNLKGYLINGARFC